MFCFLYSGRTKCRHVYPQPFVLLSASDSNTLAITASPRHVTCTNDVTRVTSSLTFSVTGRRRNVAFNLPNKQIKNATQTHLKYSVDKKNQLDVTFCILYFSSNSCSTCFGHLVGFLSTLNYDARSTTHQIYIYSSFTEQCFAFSMLHVSAMMGHHQAYVWAVYYILWNVK